MRLMLVTNPPGTGGSHKWEETTPSLEGILQEAGHTVDVTSTGEELARPDLASYDAILLNMWRNPRFGVDLEEAERDGLHIVRIERRRVDFDPRLAGLVPILAGDAGNDRRRMGYRQEHASSAHDVHGKSHGPRQPVCRGRGRLRDLGRTLYPVKRFASSQRVSALRVRGN